ncbi:MAG TPA: T9SS type A sorting domain-containing protein [Saprospiraceae bacterium]|nr:T9SS type A sorting domain-containing protein [Saprospiraceae bacterium]
MRRLTFLFIFISCSFFAKANDVHVPPPTAPEIHVDPDTLFTLDCYKTSVEVYGYSPDTNVVFQWMLPDSSLVDSNFLVIYGGGTYVLIGTDTSTNEYAIQKVKVFENYSLPNFYVNQPNYPALCGDTITVDVDGAASYHWLTPYGQISSQDLIIYESGNYILFVTDWSSGCKSSYLVEVTQDCHFGKVTGTFFYDYNQNQIRSPDEPLLTGPIAQKVDVSPSNETLYAPFGKYYKYMAMGVMYDYNWQVDPNWQLTTNNAMVSVPGSPNTLTEIEYGLYPTAQHHAMKIIMPYEKPRCNTEVSFTNWIKNIGTYPEHGKIVVTYDTLCTFVSSDGSHNLAQHEITWDYAEILPLYDRYEGLMTFLMPDETYIGTELHFLAKVYINQNGAEVLKDTYSFSPAVHCAFDPNDKQVMPAGVGEQHLTLFGEDLHYRIRFENEGNADAVRVVVTDELDNNLNTNTLEVVNASHSVQPSLRDGMIQFEFDSIFLAPGASGFVEYVISPKLGLPELTKIENTAKIYFDNNSPIVTNTTWNTLTSAIPYADLAEACVPFTVHYRADALTDVNWSFPGGTPTVSQEKEVEVTYQTKGEYETKLNFNGVSLAVPVTAYDVPEADYNFSINEQHLAEMENQSLEAETYFWDFGDGSTSTEENPIHEFLANGDSYDIVLVAGNHCGFDTISRNLIIVGVDDLDDSFGFGLYPNPNSGLFHIQADAHQTVDMELQIWDILGRQVHHQTWTPRSRLKTPIDVTYLAKGLYHYSFTAGEKQRHGSFSVE